MSLKSSMTPLESIPELSEDARAKLRGLGVTTAEELIGLARSADTQLRGLLGLDQGALGRLVAAAELHVPVSVRDSLRVAPPVRPAFGALDPRVRP